MELCGGPYSCGGLTPSISDLGLLRSFLSTTTSETKPPAPPIFVMVRPREDDFSVPYTESVVKEMVCLIHELKAAGADGFVCGVLRPASPSNASTSNHSPPLEREGGAQMEINIPRTRKLVQAAIPLPCPFHRAFDQCLPSSSSPNDFQSVRKAVNDIVATGCKVILTSGAPGDSSVLRNIARLGDIARLAEGKVEVIVGGGVRSRNLPETVDELGPGGGGG